MTALLSPQEARLFAATHVLLVHETEAMRRVSRALLSQLGVQQLLDASNAEQALAALAQARVDIVLCDWQLRGMDGLQLLERLRASDNFRQLPFVLITGETDRAVLQHAVSAGASHILVKPYSAATLADRIRRAMAAAARPKAAGLGQAAPGRSGPHSSTVLVVDDVPENLQLLAEMLRNDFRVKVAANGERALQLCQTESAPDLVLLDIMMPGMDGFEVAKRLRAHPASEHIPVIFVTALDADDVRRRAMELGAIDFVNKPVEPEQLLLRIRNFMRYVELRRQMQSEVDAMLERAKLEDDASLVAGQDVRSPLASALGLLQPLLVAAEDGARDDLLAVEEQLLAALDALHLSTELLRIESGQFQLRTRGVPLRRVLERVLRLSGEAYAHKELRLSLDVPGPERGPGTLLASGDPLLCHTLFQQLLQLACEAAPSQAAVSLQVHAEDPLRVVLRYPAALTATERLQFFGKRSDAIGPSAYAAKRLAEAQRGGVVVDTDEAKGEVLLTVVLLRSQQTVERG
ncbi:response regulator [Inhella proteolytica]|uniref:Response regulator n=1 Tax=Inhella proteolytica TaxID=2795029 RepID=A0A931NCK4_9BURK|nr:response regulator [Inhella proteolytica]MBH9575657.1 response regulator [Inhella proteolytica]